MDLAERKELALLIPPRGGIVFELGVAAGQFAEELLTVNPEMIYIGVDRWTDHHDLAEMDVARNRLRKFQGQASLIRSTFADAAKMVPDRFADLIYIDGYAHTGQDAGATLDLWWSKLRPGGYYAGHDYDKRWPKTVAVVDRFVQSHGLDLHLTTNDIYQSWWIQKP
jgi:trans-aconitate methyltransferase